MPAKAGGHHSMRRFLIAATTLLLIGWIVLISWARAFRESFGASAIHILIPTLPLILGGIILLSLFWRNRAFLIFCRIVSLVAIGSCLWLLREAPFVSVFGLLYFGIWLSYCWQEKIKAGDF